ncbi:uncharacterized protein Z519_08195 [Cladophialophora bantiana CBS 173.52]|uniref:alpha-1,2-Mannosidase n=1 Tax=Cladophialophora bantiana (strain ATCC 10958 / CBS 173.52 / CDC B-1940 / NIH 8579) TaxID=1442370 RepID=A0A0D2I314_CLAB1|nr:uncharacterized protein Z519_08195 [Cladophialophora bantiana CBS 173.52]KIW91299.1 hypothetical protein Z519_08195 [Cladophialophora bantiana CBS 173.52]
MDGMLSWLPAQFSPSRGFYSSLSREDMFKLYWRPFFRTVIVSAIIIAVFLVSRPLASSSTPIPFVKSSFDWSTYTYRHPLQSVTPLPTGKPRRFPPVQYKFRRESRAAATQRISRQQSMLKTFKKCWQSYKTHAWLKDELQSISAKSKNTFGGWAATLVDSLDTLWMMGPREEFYEAAEPAASID